MKSNASLAYNISLVMGDFLALVAAFSFGYILRVSISHKEISQSVPADTYLKIFLALLPFWILIFALLGLYNNSIYEKRFKEAGRLLIGSFIGFLFVLSYDYLSVRPIFPAHLVPIYGLILAYIFLLIFRNLARFIRSTLFHYDIGITNVLIVGNTKVAQELVATLADSRVSGYRIVGVVGNKEHTSEHYPHIKTFSSFGDAIAHLKPNDIHSIVQTELYASGEDNNDILEFAQTHHMAYRFIPGNTELFVGNIEVELFRSSVPMISVHQTALIGWGRMVKRISDLIFGTIFFLIAIPLMLVIGVIIKILEPRAPVFYKVGRVSRFGDIVKIYKFRTLKPEFNNMSPEDAFHKLGKPELIEKYRSDGDQLQNDPRNSKIGKHLRQFSLDELPQLWNVVKGDLSLVGPRALEAAELNQFSKKDLILSVKSGLTGLAQISGRRDIGFIERRQLDLYYVQNWSFWMDVMIIIKTFRVVLSRSGAR